MLYEEKIPKDMWLQCSICGEKLSDMDSVGKVGAYRSVKFARHVKEYHSIELNKYFAMMGISLPTCSCGCGEIVPVSPKGADLVVKQRVRWHHDSSNQKWIEFNNKMKKTRLGAGNPMYGKVPWNKGLTRETSEIVNNIGLKLEGKSPDKKTRKKMSKSAKNRLVHGHTGCYHSEKTKQKIREATLKQIKKGCFEHLRSEPHIIFSVILDSLCIDYEEEKIVDKFSFDFYIPCIELYVEVDGDYFHSNPCFYPDGPVTKTQKRNKYRDDIKNNFCVDNDIRLLRIWECDVLQNRKNVVAALIKEMGSHAS